MQKSTWAIIALATAAPLAWGAISVRDTRVCAGLEEDYLNVMSRLQNSVQSKTLMTQLGKSDPDFDYMIKTDENRANTLLMEIIERCGTRAAKTANQKAT